MVEQKPDAVQEVRQILFTLRIIVVSLAMGLAIFTGFAITAEPGKAGQQPRLWVMMAVLAGVLLCVRAVVPGIYFRAVRRMIAHGTWRPGPNDGRPVPTTDKGLLTIALQTKLIIACALLEGAGFNNAYAYMAERQLVSLIITLALILMILSHFPLRLWLDGWLERQMRWLDEERSLRPAEGRTP